MKLAIATLSLVLLFTVLIKPAEAHHSFWHRAKDQMTNRHGWQYGYGAYPAYNNYRGTSWGNSNPWGTYGAQQGWGHGGGHGMQQGWGHGGGHGMQQGWGHGGGHHN